MKQPTGRPERPQTKTGLPGLAGIFLSDGSSKTVLVELKGIRTPYRTRRNSP